VAGLKTEARPDWRSQQFDEEDAISCREQVARLRYLVATLLRKNEQLRQQLAGLLLANSQIFSSPSRFSENADSSIEF
jgi:hypothetical protein